ncbi:MAG: SprT family zinc-dependent metalloprotease [Gammaproteobacteria bacterium]|nr:SprT family zinc-dependent metalloprotease [Gammaproteobacteria bacterium]
MTTIQGDGFTVTVVKSKRRKTMALKVTHNGVSIHIPHSLAITTADAFILKKQHWIKNKLFQQSQRILPEKQFIEGETFLLLDKPHTLRLYNANQNATVIKNNFDLEFRGRLKRLSVSAIRAAIITWYKHYANHYLTTRTQWLSEITGLYPTSITIKTYKARWGSCSNKGEINFNWQLILAPQAVVDYVIFHELCHLRHPNHSADFWSLVLHFCPDYKLHRQWLKNNGYLLAI